MMMNTLRIEENKVNIFLDKREILWQAGIVYYQRGCPSLRASRDMARKGVSYLDHLVRAAGMPRGPRAHLWA